MWADEYTGRWDEDFIERLLEWLGYDGVAFFRMCKEISTGIDPYNVVWTEVAPGKDVNLYGVPHPVHFREGMAVRNTMRRIHTEMGAGIYGAHFYDNHWQSAVTAAIKMCEEGRYEPAGVTED